MMQITFENCVTFFADLNQYIVDPAREGKRVSIITDGTERVAKALMMAVLGDWLTADTLEGNEVPDIVEEISEMQQLPIYIGQTFKEDCDIYAEYGWGNDALPYFKVSNSTDGFTQFFKDGDYVKTAGGNIIIFGSMPDNDYYCHAWLTNKDELIIRDYTSERPLAHIPRPGDRLCTEEEMMRINGELMKAGKIFDPVQKKVVDSEALSPSVVRFMGYLLDSPIISQRGNLTTKDEIQECITAYEARIQELTEMCNEIYAKLNALNLNHNK